MAFKENTIIAKSFTPMKNTVYVTDLDIGTKKSAGGIILMDDNMTERGIRNRWARVYAVGAGVDDLTPGEWVLVQHGRWTNGVDFQFPDQEKVTLWRIDYPEAVILVTDEDPRDTQDFSFEN